MASMDSEFFHSRERPRGYHSDDYQGRDRGDSFLRSRYSDSLDWYDLHHEDSNSYGRGRNVDRRKSRRRPKEEKSKRRSPPAEEFHEYSDEISSHGHKQSKSREKAEKPGENSEKTKKTSEGEEQDQTPMYVGIGVLAVIILIIIGYFIATSGEVKAQGKKEKKDSKDSDSNEDPFNKDDTEGTGDPIADAYLNRELPEDLQDTVKLLCDPKRSEVSKDVEKIRKTITHMIVIGDSCMLDYHSHFFNEPQNRLDLMKSDTDGDDGEEPEFDTSDEKLWDKEWIEEHIDSFDRNSEQAQDIALHTEMLSKDGKKRFVTKYPWDVKEMHKKNSPKDSDEDSEEGWCGGKSSGSGSDEDSEGCCGGKDSDEKKKQTQEQLFSPTRDTWGAIFSNCIARKSKRDNNVPKIINVASAGPMWGRKHFDVKEQIAQAKKIIKWHNKTEELKDWAKPESTACIIQMGADRLKGKLDAPWYAPRWLCCCGTSEMSDVTEFYQDLVKKVADAGFAKHVMFSPAPLIPESEIGDVSIDEAVLESHSKSAEGVTKPDGLRSFSIFDQTEIIQEKKNEWKKDKIHLTDDLHKAIAKEAIKHFAKKHSK